MSGWNLWYQGWVVTKTFKGHRGRPGQRGGSAPKGTAGTIPGRSSTEAILKGKKLGGKEVKNIYKDPKRPKDRQVEFADGSKKWIPSAVLAKAAYGSGRHGESPFASVKEARKNGFVSLAQATYLKNSLPDVYDKIVADTKAGRRYWDSEAGKMVTKKKEYDPYYLADDELFLELEEKPLEEVLARYMK